MSVISSQFFLVPKATQGDLLLLHLEHGHNHRNLAVALIDLYPNAANVADIIINALEGNGVAIAYYAGNEWMMHDLQPSAPGNKHDVMAMD